MPTHIYTAEEKRDQLRHLIDSLEELINFIEKSDRLPKEICAPYRAALDEAQCLLATDFVQSQLTELGNKVPDLFYRYKEWSPPSELQPDGTYDEPEWFKELEARLQPALKAAFDLISVGYY